MSVSMIEPHCKGTDAGKKIGVHHGGLPGMRFCV